MGWGVFRIDKQIECELLIVGGGIAGLAAAVEAKKHGFTPLLVSQSTLGSGASYFPLKATLGIQVTGDEADKAHFWQDIQRVGQGKLNPNIARTYIEHSPESIPLLHEIGFRPWQRQDNRPACFADYARPIFLINDWANAAERAKQIFTEKQIDFCEKTTLLHLVVRDNHIQGALLGSKTSGQIQTVFCKTDKVILAAGGIAGLYQDNLYPADVNGSVHSVAQRAGATLENLEFIQFIPAFVEPKYKVLFGEHTLKYVEKVTDSQGRDLFPDYSGKAFREMMRARSDYAPFSADFACRAFDLRLMQHLADNPQEKGVYLHYSPALYQDDGEFYRVYLDWLKSQAGIDLLQQPIAIAPFAHSCNGGVKVNEWGETGVGGLFAIGELAHTVEGANRLGGNSVGGGLVFARQAVRKLLENAKNAPDPSACISLAEVEAEINALANPNGDNDLSAATLLQQVRQKMSRYANVYRNRHNLQHLSTELQALADRFNPLAGEALYGISAYNALQTARQVVTAMLENQQTLGAHYRADDRGE